MFISIIGVVDYYKQIKVRRYLADTQPDKMLLNIAYYILCWTREVCFPLYMIYMDAMHRFE